MNSYDDEATRFEAADNEETRYSEATEPKFPLSDHFVDDSKSKRKPSHDLLKSAGVGAGFGLLIGGVAPFLMSMAKATPDHAPESEEGEGAATPTHPAWADDQMQVASSVNDNMSFNEAFAAARAEVGPGGSFEWHGQVFGTYTATEWNDMTAQEQAQFGSHFNWNNLDTASSDVAQQTDNQQEMPQNDFPQEAVEAEVVEIEDDDPEVEILGVVHDDESGANIGDVIIDDQEVVLIDVDDDQVFDYAAADLNDNDQFDQDEFVDIQNEGLTVDSLGGFTDPEDDLLASNDSSDYTPDDIYGE